MRAAIFIVLFGLVFAFATVTHDYGGLGFGWHSFSSYGWPKPWLKVHTMRKTIVIHSDGTREGDERTQKWSIAWRGLVVSAGAAGAITGLLCSPLIIFWPTPKPISRHERIGKVKP
jgi:hypothetical protein